MKLRNDKILVFGGGSGIGQAIAKRFCDAGARVLITGRNEEKLKVAAKDINQKYERHAIERFIRPDEIAELAFYLMSDYGEIICGHTVVADGGDNAATL